VTRNLEKFCKFFYLNRAQTPNTRLPDRNHTVKFDQSFKSWYGRRRSSPESVGPLNLAGKCSWRGRTWAHKWQNVAYSVHLHCMELQINHMHLPDPIQLVRNARTEQGRQRERGLVGGSWVEWTSCLASREERTKETFSWPDKPAEKHCWLIYCERKILFCLKKQAEKNEL
jgi:hypothetical protein